jgi:RNA polymerase sigma factor (sigma-70 family)
MSDPDHLTDTELLAAYGRSGDEAAFEKLARRHVDMLFAVSLRRTKNRQLAEEATQNVLLSLSKKARKLSLQESNLTGWLHKSTRFEVAKLQRREARIRKREEAYASANMNASDEENTFQRLLPLLDQAIDSLRAPDREVVVRRYLEEQSFSHIGAALGISEDAAQKRTSRALERLNRFFRRKAGVTVSATAIAAGISRHCVEAAPAACLNIAGKAASAGLASFLTTTLTLMSIHKTAAVVAAIVILGGTTAILATRDPTPTDTVATPPPPADGGLPMPGDGAVAATVGNSVGNPKPYSANEELAKLEAMSPHPGKDELTRRLSVKYDRLLKDLTKDLGLNAAQTAPAKVALDARLKSFRASLDSGPEPGDSPEESMKKEKDMLSKAGGLIRGVGLREDLAGILSEKQLAAFDEREAKEWQTQVEAHAYRELANLTPVLDLSGQQKDKTFELLQVSSSEKLKGDADIRAFMAMQKNQAPVQMDLTDMAEADFLSAAFDGSSPLALDSPEFTERLTALVGGQIDAQVDLLAPVLDERQRQRYRDYLVSKSALSAFGLKLPTPDKQ